MNPLLLQLLDRSKKEPFRQPFTSPKHHSFAQLMRRRKQEQHPPAASLPLAVSFDPAAPSTSAGSRSPAALATALYQRLLQELFQLQKGGTTETTFCWQLAGESDVLVTIREFSSAPKAFNIELQCAAETQRLLSSQLESLRQQLQQQQHRFSIHRLECTLLTHQQRLPVRQAAGRQQ